MRLRTFLKPLSFIPALLLMYMIYHFSAQEADISTDMSYKASYRIVSTVNYVFDTDLDDYQISDYAWRINGITRKLAHMTEYFLLAVAMSFPLYIYGLRGILLVLVAGGICVGFACTDEYHQSFVAGRAASYKDIGIDSFGVLVGIILVRIIGWTGRHTIFAPTPDERYEKMTRKEMKRYRKKQKQMERELKELRRDKQAQSAFRPAGPDHGDKNPADPYGRGWSARPADPGDPYSTGASGHFVNPGKPYAPGTSGHYAGYAPSGAGMPSGGSYPPYDAPVTSPHDPYAGSGSDPSRPVFYGQRYGQMPPQDFYDEEPEVSSDELSDDMPLSKLLKPKS